MSLVVADKISYSPVNGGGIEVTVPFRQRIVSEGMGAAMYEMFGRGEKGLWYDPSDLPTMFQDSAGTTAAAIEQPVGLLLDKSKGLVLGPELVTNGTFDSDTTWTKDSGITISGGEAIFSGASSGRGVYKQELTHSAGKFYSVSYDLNLTSGSVAVWLGVYGATRTTSGSYTQVIKAGSTNNLVGVFSITPSTTATVDNISVKELPGNHATQATSTARPVLRARYNMLTYSEQFGNAVWVNIQGVSSVSANSVLAPDGTLTADKIIPEATTLVHGKYQTPVFQTGAQYSFTVWVKQVDAGVHFEFFCNDTTQHRALVNLTDGTVALSQSVTVSVSGLDSYGFRKVILSFTFAAATGPQQLQLRLTRSTSAYDQQFVGDGSTGLVMWGAQLNYGSAALPYQRIAAATDYDTVGFKPYLDFDGVDDFLVTPSIDFTGTDKMSVFAGVDSNQITTAGIIVEHGSGGVPNMYLAARLGIDGDFGWNTSGTASAAYRTTAANNLALPWVVSCQHNIGGALISDEIKPRVNGVIPALTVAQAGPAGTGNFGSFPFYIGMRAGTSLPFNGRIYSLIVRGALSDAVEINDSERYVNNKTGAYQ